MAEIQQLSIKIPYRPYGINAENNLMNPDGFFITNFDGQYIETSINNEEIVDLQNVRVYIEGLSDPGIILTPVINYEGTVPAKSSFQVRFFASFSNASPGIAFVSFIVESDGFFYKRVIKKIYILEIALDQTRKMFVARTGDGNLEVKYHKVITSQARRRCRCENRCKHPKSPWLFLPEKMSYNWIPKNPFPGQHDRLPYEDPWWKVVLAVLALLLIAGAVLYDVLSDGDLDGGVVTVGGTFDETNGQVDCCTDVTVDSNTSNEEDFLLWSLYSAAGAAASTAIYSDGPDPTYRGRMGTNPNQGELTTSELVDAKITYLEPPQLGKPFKVDVEWQYTRTTTGQTYKFDAKDSRENEHFLTATEIMAPDRVQRYEEPLIVRARFNKPGDDRQYFRGDELYVQAYLLGPNGEIRSFQLRDDGRDPDGKSGDSIYTGSYYFRSPNKQDSGDSSGIWYLYVIAQDVNHATDDMDPVTAAHNIGGLVLTDQFKMRFNDPCEIRANRGILVT